MRRHTMLTKLSLFAMLTLLSLIFISACGKLGDVDQGRVIEFNKDKGTVTIISDMDSNPANPDYTHLPPITYAMPKDPAEIGALPKAGMRMKLNIVKNQIVIFDTASQNFKTIDYKLIDQKEKVEKDDPLVYDQAADKSKSFPVVDREKKIIVVYSKRQKILTTFSLPDEYFSLPDNTWDSGDEVRIYYKTEGQARRFMNISKTDIFKK